MRLGSLTRSTESNPNSSFDNPVDWISTLVFGKNRHSNRTQFESRKMEESDLVRVVVLETEVEANFVKGFLEDHEIDALIAGLETSALGAALDGDSEIEVFVASADVEKAKVLIEELINEDAEPIPAWTCGCGEDVDEGFFVCWSCDAEFKPELANGKTTPPDESKVE